MLRGRVVRTGHFALTHPRKLWSHIVMAASGTGSRACEGGLWGARKAVTIRRDSNWGAARSGNGARHGGLLLLPSKASTRSRRGAAKE